MASRADRTRLDPEVRRELILDAAEEVFRNRPASEVTFEAVADAAGVSRALVYNYFGDRSGLLAAVELRSLQRLDQSLRAALDPTRSPSQQLRPLAQVYRELARTDGSTWRVLASFGGDRHPSVRAARRNRIENLAACWGGDDLARVAAQTVTAMLEAAARGDDDVDTDESIDPVWAREAVCRILEDGLERAGVGSTTFSG
jgi:AcrR family transcriptional regulator